MTAVSFRASGQPVPQGSSRAFARNGRAHVVSTTPRLADWRHAVATEARAAMAGQPLMEGPVTMLLSFGFVRPAAHFLPANARRPVRELRPDAPKWHDQTPDADKLVRSCLDAMTGVVYRDDRQVAVLAVCKFWAADGEQPGVSVTAETTGGSAT